MTIYQRVMSPRANDPEGEAVVNDSPGDCQSRRTDRSIFSAEKMQDREVQIPPPQPYCASLMDATPKNPDAIRLLGFFVPIFHSAILIDANAEKRRVDGI